MARDPLSWSLEDEKRRRGDLGPSRNRPLTPPEFALQPPPEGAGRRADAETYAAAASQVRDGLRRRYDTEAAQLRQRGVLGTLADSAAFTGRGLLDVNRAVGDTVETALLGERSAPPPAPRQDFSNVRGGVAQGFGNVESGSAPTQTDLSDPRLGLTRITRLPDGSFTDTADPGVGQDRYYDRTGRRVDTAGYGNSHGLGDASVSGPDAVRAYNRSVNASAMDMTDPANQRIVAERGTRGLARSAAMQQEALARAAYTAEMQMTPEQRAERDRLMIEQSGLDRRSQAQIDASLRIAGARSQSEAQRAAFEQTEDRERYERELAREDPTAFVQEQMALLSNYHPDDVAAYLARDNNRLGSMLRDAVRRAGTERLGADFTPAQTVPASSFRRFVHSPLTLGLTAPARDANNNILFDDLFNPEDIIPGMNDEWYDIFTRADLQNRGAR